MRVVHLSFSDLLPGACSLSHRMHEGLKQASVDSHMVVARKLGDDPSVHGPSGRLAEAKASLANRLEWYLRKALVPNDREVSLGIFGSGMLGAVRDLRPDVVHVHWVGGGVIRPEALRRLSEFPTVLTLHDMWPVAGIRHYEPVGGEPVPPDGQGGPNNAIARFLDVRSRSMKQRAWRVIPQLTIHCYSSWIRDVAKGSNVLADREIELVRIGIDLDAFSPGDRAAARRELDIPDGAANVTFGAVQATSSPRKGFALLREALWEVGRGWSGPPLILTVFGAEGGGGDLPFPVRYLGMLDSEADMARAYRAADVFVAPSTQEVLGQTVVEALACGTPVAGFSIGGLPDAITQETGHLAKPYDTTDLAEGIGSLALAAHGHGGAATRLRARHQAERLYDRYTQTLELVNLYERLLSRARRAV